MAKKILAVRKKQTWSLRMITIGVLVGIIGLSFFIYHVRKNSTPNFISQQVFKIKNWIATRKNHLNKDLAKAKHLAENSEEPEIHFEFYNTLPNTQLSVPIAQNTQVNKNIVAAPLAAALTKNQQANKNVEKSAPAVLAQNKQIDKNMVAAKSNTAAKTKSNIKTVSIKKPFNAELLEHELSKKIKGKQ